MTDYDERSGQTTKVVLSDGSNISMGPETKSATIAENEALSGEIDVRGKISGAVHMPAAWTAASLGLYAAPSSGGTFAPVYDKDGSLYTVSVDASRCIIIDPQILVPLRYIKLWSQDGSGSNVTQGAERSFSVDLY